MQNNGADRGAGKRYDAAAAAAATDNGEFSEPGLEKSHGNLRQRSPSTPCSIIPVAAAESVLRACKRLVKVVEGKNEEKKTKDLEKT